MLHAQHNTLIFKATRINCYIKTKQEWQKQRAVHLGYFANSVKPQVVMDTTEYLHLDQNLT